MSRLTIFTKPQLRYIEIMRDRGKTYADIAFELHCSTSAVWNACHPKKENPNKGKHHQHKPKPTKTIREILAEPTFEVLPPNCCNITCCNDRQNCSILDHPQDCLVWQLYHNTDKQKLETTYYDQNYD